MQSHSPSTHFKIKLALLLLAFSFMAESAADARKRCVQTLRAAAKKCDVEPIRDSASRQKVNALAQSIADSAGPAAQKSKALAALEEYEATWVDHGDEDGAGEENDEGQEVKDFRLRGTSFLFTYNWDFWGKAFADCLVELPIAEWVEECHLCGRGCQAAYTFGA